MDRRVFLGGSGVVAAGLILNKLEVFASQSSPAIGTEDIGTLAKQILRESYNTKEGKRLYFLYDLPHADFPRLPNLFGTAENFKQDDSYTEFSVSIGWDVASSGQSPQPHDFDANVKGKIYWGKDHKPNFDDSRNEISIAYSPNKPDDYVKATKNSRGQAVKANITYQLGSGKITGGSDISGTIANVSDALRIEIYNRTTSATNDNPEVLKRDAAYVLKQTINFYNNLNGR